MFDFNSMDLLPAIKNTLKLKGYSKPTPIQGQTIPYVLDGKDVLGIAQTGTGKTAAFCLPIINKLAQNKIKVKPARARVLILTPTRELASQINSQVKLYSAGLNISSTVIFGGVSKVPQIQTMSRGVDILIATPGRLLDLMYDGHIFYDQLEVFVLDEADRMLDMGFINDIKRIINKLPEVKQTLLFSATMPHDIAKLANSLLSVPVRVEVTPQTTTVKKINQKVNFVQRTNKPLLLRSILKSNPLSTALIFTRTKYAADRVVKYLEKDSINSAAIHSNKSQGARERALNGFRDGKIKVLVATDIAARGIDVPNIGYVINYNLPEDPESYIHRIGRTGRAGKKGIAISFCDETELNMLKNVERFIKGTIPVDEDQPFHNVPAQFVSGRPASTVRQKGKARSPHGSSTAKNKKRPNSRPKSKRYYTSKA